MGKLEKGDFLRMHRLGVYDVREEQDMRNSVSSWVP